MAWGNKIDQFIIQRGETLAVSIDLESQEYNGRWYTGVKAWKVSRDGFGADNPQSYNHSDNYGSTSTGSPSINGDDIPF